MERSGDLALFDRTDVLESPGEAMGENAAQLQWGSENVKTLSSEGPRKWCVNKGSEGRGE